MSLDMLSQKNVEQTQNDYTGISLFTVAIRLQGEKSNVVGTMDSLTHGWLDTLVSDAIWQSILQNSQGLELLSTTAQRSKFGSTSPKKLIAMLNTLSGPDRRLAIALDPKLLLASMDCISEGKR